MGMGRKLIYNNDNMSADTVIHGMKAIIFMLKQSPICLLLLLLTACIASAPATDDNRDDYTDYGIIQPSSTNDDSNDMVFGGERHFNLNTVATVATNNSPITTNNPSFTSVNQTIILPALAVERTDITEYQRAIGATDWSDINEIRTITVVDIISPAVSFALGASSNISSVTTHFSDKTYIGTGISNSFITSGAADSASDARIEVDRSIDAFGFNTQYMAHIEWTLKRPVITLTATNPEDSIYDIVGVMVAGIETEDTMIPSDKLIAFEGEGKGEYGEEDKKYQTIFNIKANIDFTNRLATINSSETMRCTLNDGCTIGAGNLDFRATNLSFSKNNLAVNIISGDLLLIGDTSFTGNINARFYGPQAEEFGGTFALTEKNERYYYGTFGGENIGVIDDKDYDNDDNGFPLVATALSYTMNYDGYDSLDDASAGAISDVAVKTLTLPALAVQRNSGTPPNFKRITKTGNESSFLSISFDTSGYISATNASFESTTYMLTGGTPASSTILSGATNVTATTNVMKAIRADSSLLDSFAPKYMAYVTWELVGNGGVDSDGYMMAGIETAGTGLDAIPTQDITVTFWGNGIGTYHSDTPSHHAAVKFDARAKVNFADQTVALSSTNTRCVASCSLSADDLNNLEFDTSNNQTAKYYQGVNVIAGNIENADATMTGRFDARFYGKNAVELGGTFIMKNTDGSSYYLGAFGAERP